MKISHTPLVRASLDQAIAWIDAHSATLGTEEIGLDEASGRVLAVEIQAPAPIPPFACAAADGHALCAAETVGASDYNPLSFALCESGPVDALPASSAAPIVAGAALPRGADAVLPSELAQADGAKLKVFGPVAHGWGIVAEAQQLPAGATVAEAGRVLLPPHIGMVALAGIQQVQAVRRPRVRLFVFSPKPSGADVNTLMLRQLIERDGGVVAGTKSADEPHKDLAKVLQQAMTAADADLMLIAGRSGHGADDSALRAIAECCELESSELESGELESSDFESGEFESRELEVGKVESGEVAIHGVAMRPGGSASLGVVGQLPVLLLPGDPLGCWSAYEMLAGRFIRRMAGLSPELPYRRQQAEVAHKIVSGIGVVELCRVRLVQGKIEPVGPAESGGLASVACADGFVLVPAPLEGFAPGARVEAFFFEQDGRAEKSRG